MPKKLIRPHNPLAAKRKAKAKRIAERDSKK